MRMLGALLFLAGCGSGVAGGDPVTPPSARTTTPPDAAAPALIGPGVISTEGVEFAWSTTADGREAYFNRAQPDRSSFAIYVTRREGDAWSAPEVASFSGTYLDADPFVTADGRRLFFSSNRPNQPGGTPDDFNLWVVESVGDRWGEPTQLPAPINSDGTEIYTTLSRDGTLYFNSDRTGERLIYRAQPSGAGFSPPALVDIPGPAGRRPGNPAIAPDGDALVFVDTVDGSPTSGDMLITRRDGQGWATPTVLGDGFRSEWADFAPCYSHDGAWLTFTSERPGVVDDWPDGERRPGDIYRLPAP